MTDDIYDIKQLLDGYLGWLRDNTSLASDGGLGRNHHSVRRSP